MNFPSILLSGNGLSLMRILGSASKAIGIFKQISPIINDVKPLLSKMPKLIERLNNVRENSLKFKNRTLQTLETLNAEKNIKTSINPGPTFFQ